MAGLSGMIIVFFLNYGLLEYIIIPDPCYYHGEETTKLFDLFYKFTSDEGYHPSPTTFNYILTIALGIASGIFTYYQIARSEK